MSKLSERESRFSEPFRDDSVRCIICPRMCVIKPGQRGFCNTKENKGGRLISLTYGLLSAIAVDPIEKKPLAHFYPGSLAYSISSVGCSFTCAWCQNWHLSQAKPGEIPVRYVSPEEVVKGAKREECTSIAYTYNEPLINLDYVEDVARLARKEGVKNVLVTNGYISQEALERVVDVVDAANVDWKAFSEPFYRKYCSADLKSVLDATATMKRRGVHVEVTFLIIPEVHDWRNEAREMAKYLVENLGPDTPLHLSRFFPHYKFSHLPPTPVEHLIKAREIAMNEGVRYVYVGNVPYTDYENTFCPRCGKAVIEREGYDIVDWHLDEENRCEYCGESIPIVGRRERHRRFHIF
ncbi:MAG: AmmeMemoRadiSam system radical SAM enzyme [Candidatus Bathyarchaeia archaeon]|nr:AmmeMemoRadiSam system radical SAM enzyme [Candidatus Bathyarchaeota archaeon]